MIHTVCEVSAFLGKVQSALAGEPPSTGRSHRNLQNHEKTQTHKHLEKKNTSFTFKTQVCQTSKGSMCQMKSHSGVTWLAQCWGRAALDLGLWARAPGWV